MLILVVKDTNAKSIMGPNKCKHYFCQCLASGVLVWLGLQKEDVEPEDNLTLAIKRGILAVQVQMRKFVFSLDRKEISLELTSSFTLLCVWPRILDMRLL